MSDLWVFGYGSLMWRPGFAYDEIRPAVLTGYRRSFCIYSVHHRGTARRPGLVLGLDRGGQCHGLAFKVDQSRVPQTLAYLRAREQVNGVYRETAVTLDTGVGTDRISALAYIAERDHPSYAGRLPLAKQADLIRAASGLSGSNLEYLASTLDHLTALNLRERELERLMARASPLFNARDIAVRQSRIATLVNSSHRLSVKAPLMTRAERRRFMHRQAVKGGSD
jgi:glutathione-specific gamma-glutamylcyclotransferase